MAVDTRQTQRPVHARRPRKWPVEAWFRLVAALSCLVIVLVMVGILFQLWANAMPAIRKFGLGFLASSAWDPVRGDFGALTSIYGTVASTLIALVIAVPMSLVIALFLVELAPKRLSGFFGTAIELLAAIPSIIYGMWGLFVFAPFMANHVQPFLQRYLGHSPLFQGPPMGIGMLTAGIILALMILPFISSVMRDVLQMVPPVIKESAYGLGATTWEVTKDVSIRFGVKGMVGAIFLGLGRAVGETMAVTFVIGNDHRLATSLFASGNTIASTLANEFTEADKAVYLSSLVYLALALFIITGIFQAIAHMWLRYADSKGSKR